MRVHLEHFRIPYNIYSQKNLIILVLTLNVFLLLYIIPKLKFYKKIINQIEVYYMMI